MINNVEQIKKIFTASDDYAEALKNPKACVNRIDTVELPEIFAPVIADANKAKNGDALRAYKIFVLLGVKFTKEQWCPGAEKMEELIANTAEVLHDMWSKEMLASGWAFSMRQDDERKLHTDLLPLGFLTTIYPYKDEKYRNEANGALQVLKRTYGIVPKI